MNVVNIDRKEEEKAPSLIEQAEMILQFLNVKTQKNFRARNPKGSPTANADFVIHRLKEGYSVQDCKQVIALKAREWGHDEKMSRYLTPETLFRRSNFERYLGECS